MISFEPVGFQDAAPHEAIDDAARRRSKPAVPAVPVSRLPVALPGPLVDVLGAPDLWPATIGAATRPLFKSQALAGLQ